MKKLLLLIAAIIAVMALTACGSDDEDTIRGFTRGTWSGTTFTSEQMGVTFTAPANWMIATDAEMAEIMGLGIDMMRDELTPAILESAGLTTVQDMMATNPETGAMVQIMAERLVFPNNRISTQEYVDVVEEMLVGMGMEVNRGFANRRLGNYTWYVYESVLEIMPGIYIYGHYFVDVRDGFALTIQVVYSSFSESLEEILTMFR